MPEVVEPIGAADLRAGVAADRRVRRIGAGILFLAGLMSVVSAVTPPIRSRIEFINDIFPLAIPQIATVLVAISGLALMLLSRGVRRGQRLAWRISVVLLGVTAVLHLIKAADVEEGVVTALVAVYLGMHRRSFAAIGDRPSLMRGLLTAAFGGVAALVGGVAGVELYHPRESRVRFGRAVTVVAERLVGVYTLHLRPGNSDRFDRLVGPGITAVGIGLLAYALALAFRPVVLSRRPPAGDYTRARDIVRRWGGDTLAYFALRDDKRWWFWGSTVVAYAIFGGVCLVSPDPIGPPGERAEAWSAFHRFADDNGWPVAVMGAGDEWLPVYRAAGMRDLYIGDEAVVDCQQFSLQGGDMKGLRQAVNRIARYGYRMEFYDPARVGPDLRAELRHVMAQNRRGDAERGFSMTLGRIFDPDDKGLLLAVAYGPACVAVGAEDSDVPVGPIGPVAFCHYVPAASINGYSLDLMRRTDGPHPNGLIDFVVVRTIEHLRDEGLTGLGLNFATMRAVMAGETGDAWSQRMQRWLLRRLSDSMQIESLWKYNAKFAPTWRPRYAVWDLPENMLPAALAVARAESFFELPVIGRFLTPEGDVEDPEAVRSSTAPPGEG
jgi:lysylphosphatidylglycerol synthetase-like protein (DUF2156 family)